MSPPITMRRLGEAPEGVLGKRIWSSVLNQMYRNTWQNNDLMRHRARSRKRPPADQSRRPATPRITPIPQAVRRLEP